MPKSRSRKKKKSGVSRMQGQQFSPLNYIKKKGRSLPVKEVFVSQGWEEMAAMCIIAVVKEQPSGNYILGIYLLDTGCLGLKNTTVEFNLTPDKLDEKLDKYYEMFQGKYETMEYDLANEMIYGAINYASDLGFKPNKDFKHTTYLLKAEKEVGDEYELEFGDEDGKPLFMAGPYDDAYAVINKLTAKVGPDGFKFINMVDAMADEENEDED